jgi:hypothetical protein
VNSEAFPACTHSVVLKCDLCLNIVKTHWKKEGLVSVAVYHFPSELNSVVAC